MIGYKPYLDHVYHELNSLYIQNHKLKISKIKYASSIETPDLQICGQNVRLKFENISILIF